MRIRGEEGCYVLL